MKPTRAATARRWMWIFVYSALGLWFGGFAALLYHRLWQLIFRLWPSSLLELEYPFLAGTSAVLFAALLRFAGVRPVHARHFWRYPPVWASFLIIGAGLLAVDVFYRDVLSIGRTGELVVASCVAGSWLVTGLVLPLLYRRPHRAQNIESEQRAVPRRLDNLSAAELQAWLSDEREIASAEQDFFGAVDRAQRIWNALKTHRSAAKPHSMQTVVLEGPFGSGKTSVIGLLRKIVQEEGENRYLLIQVSAWGFSSAAARQHILNQVIEVLANEVDCLGVRDLPRDYVEALMESTKWFALLKPSLSELAPAERLKRLLPILTAIDIHLIVVIEDSDRNDVDFNPQHLQSMLNDFREVERLSFILTVGSTSRVDFPKIAEQIESIPRLSRDDALSLLDRVRDYCREQWPAIDPLADEPE